MSRNWSASVPGGPMDCQVAPLFVVRRTVPALPLAHAKAGVLHGHQRRSVAAVDPVRSHHQFAGAGGDQEGRQPRVVRTEAAQERPPFRRARTIVDEWLLQLECGLRGFAPGGERESALAEHPGPAEPVGERHGADPGGRIGPHVGDIAQHVALV